MIESIYFNKIVFLDMLGIEEGNNPFNFTGCCTELPSEHPYWKNYTKVRRCTEALLLLKNVSTCLKDPFAKKIILGNGSQMNNTKKHAEKMLLNIDGAQNKISEPMSYPCGSLIIN